MSIGNESEDVGLMAVLVLGPGLVVIGQGWDDFSLSALFSMSTVWALVAILVLLVVTKFFWPIALAVSFVRYWTHRIGTIGRRR